MRKRVPFIALVLAGCAVLVAAKWDRMCYLKGAADAHGNIAWDRKITYEYGLAGHQNDTIRIADSLLYYSFGFEARGTGCVISSSFAHYIDGYASIYDPYVEANFKPAARQAAKKILEQRPADWKSRLTPDEKKMRLLFGDPSDDLDPKTRGELNAHIESMKSL